MTLTYVEDYLEFLFGTFDKEGNPTSKSFNESKPISLATYDKNPIISMGNACCRARLNNYNECLTDRQVELARKIIFKYRKQFLSFGIVLPTNEQEVGLRYSTRAIDRTKSMKHNVDNKQVTLKFPYDPKKISTLHEYASNSAGKLEWNNTSKHWQFDLTEPNLSTVLKLFQNEDLIFDESLTEHVTDILSTTTKDLPTFALADDTMELINCHPSVREYLSSIDWDPKQLNKLSNWVCQATALGLQIDTSVTDALLVQNSKEVVDIITNRKVVLPSKNLHNGPWYDSLLAANEVLSNYPWVLYLSWWTNKTDWTPFKNLIKYEQNTSSRINFAEKLHSLTDPIVVMDTVIGKESVRSFIENNSIKVIYISDIGH